MDHIHNKEHVDLEHQSLIAYENEPRKKATCTHDHEHDHKSHQVCILESDEKFQKKVKGGNRAMRKLWFVVIICFFFMIAEIVGGIMSDSLAILTDAAHMLSDVGGFAISILSIWIGQKAPTQERSFGYHRAEVLGALASLLIIWAMVILLVVEATERVLKMYMFKEEINIDAPIMLVTAFISLICNIFSLIALEHIPFCRSKDATGFMDSFTSIYKPHGGCGDPNCSSKHHNHDHDHDHKHEHGPGCSHSHHDHKHHDHHHNHDHGKKSHHNDHHHHHEHSHENGHNHDKIHADKSVHHHHHSHSQISVETADDTALTASSLSDHSHSDLKHKILENDNQSHDQHKGHSHDEHEHHHHHDHDDREAENINVRAAVVHVIGDMLQSVGVIIAALLIWKYPDAKIADPICTYLFSILVILTTVPVFKECISVLMEYQPSGIDAAKIKDDIRSHTDGIIDIQDFHVWALAGGKNVLTAHIEVNCVTNHENAHAQVMKIIDKYDICHPTLQILRGGECRNSLWCTCPVVHEKKKHHHHHH